MFSSIKPKPNNLSRYNTCSIDIFLEKSKDNNIYIYIYIYELSKVSYN